MYNSLLTSISSSMGFTHSFDRCQWSVRRSWRFAIVVKWWRVSWIWRGWGRSRDCVRRSWTRGCCVRSSWRFAIVVRWRRVSWIWRGRGRSRVVLSQLLYFLFRTMTKYSDLAAECREAGWKTTIYPVEVGCRCFVGQSTTRLLRDAGVTGGKLKKATKELRRRRAAFSCG